MLKVCKQYDFLSLEKEANIDFLNRCPYFFKKI